MPREINVFYVFKISDEGLVIVICFNTLLWGLYVLYTSVISYEFHTALMQIVQPWNVKGKAQMHQHRACSYLAVIEQWEHDAEGPGGDSGPWCT